MKTKGEMSFYILATLKSANLEIDSIPCRILLPERLADPIELRFNPTRDQGEKIEALLPKYSLYGEIRDSSGIVRVVISAKEVWTDEMTFQDWGPELVDIHFTGEPVDLTVVERLFGEPDDSKTVSGAFWLTPSKLLSPRQKITRSYTGQVTVETVWEFAFTFPHGFGLKFRNCHRYLKSANGDTISFVELVAEHQHAKIAFDGKVIGGLLQDLDDLLLLVSLAERRYCVCLGWEMAQANHYSRFYRRSIYLPKPRSGNDPLIEPAQFPDFISKAYDSFVGKGGMKEFLRRAVHLSIPRSDQTVENTIVALFSAIETLVLGYRKEHDFEKVLPSREWKLLSQELRKWIDGHAVFKGQPARRQYVLDKLGDLNRISFASAFKSFCTDYAVDVHDLWPVNSGTEGITLSRIRNKLVHGEVVTRENSAALSTAELHLRWTVERMLLGVLEWPTEKSSVDQRRLLGINQYHSWKEDRENLSRSSMDLPQTEI